MMNHSSGRVLLIAAIIFGGAYLMRDGSLNGPAPTFSLPDAYGGSVDLASYRGRPVLLVFWMASCGICREELPRLSRLAPEFRGRGIEVLTIHLGSLDDAREYVSSNHIALRPLVDAEGAAGREYRVSGVPKLVLIDAGGKILRTSEGMTDESVLREWMDAAGGS